MPGVRQQRFSGGDEMQPMQSAIRSGLIREFWPAWHLFLMITCVPLCFALSAENALGPDMPD
jgi:hypothetical protein